MTVERAVNGLATPPTLGGCGWYAGDTVQSCTLLIGGWR
jgi:hypothetical protein